MDQLFGTETLTTIAITTANEGLILFSRDVNRYTQMALQAIWSAGASNPAGTFVWKGSNDGTNWETVSAPVFAPTAVSGASGHAGSQQTAFGYRYLGLALTSITGTFNLSLILNGKGT